MPKYKHLTLSDRILIEQALNRNDSFKKIARCLNRDCTSISKEVRKHIESKQIGTYGKPFNDCVYRYDCKKTYLCEDPTCSRKYCRFCSKCHTHCKDYEKYLCPKLFSSPYVCNPCSSKRSCTLEKGLYTATWAHKKYRESLSESRSGVCVDEKEKARLDGLVSPLIMKGQSLHHIWATNKDEIMLSEKTLYNYTDYNFFTARNIDLPRKVRYRPRKKKKDSFKVDRACRIGRSYEDFQAYMEKNPDTAVVEMDSVEGNKGGKVLLTIHFTTSSFMLAYIRDANTSQSVIDIYEDLYSTLGKEAFKRLFPLILTDIGSEFSNPSAIEFDANGDRRTKLFYCDPASPYQKGAIENNHEMIRRIVPQGKSFDKYDQNHIKLMMDHINSYARKKLNDKSPHSLFSFLHGTDVLRKLDAKLIIPNDITLTPELLK